MQTANADDSALSVLLHPRTANALSKLKDSTDQPLRLPPALENVAFRPTTKIPINQTKGTSSDASTAIMGDFSQCWIGVRMEARVEILKEVYAANYQLGFLVSLRADVQFSHLESFGKITGITPE